MIFQLADHSYGLSNIGAMFLDTPDQLAFKPGYPHRMFIIQILYCLLYLHMSNNKYNPLEQQQLYLSGHF